MANAHDYFEYLTGQVGISPANSQEELDAAQAIAELMREHGVETTVEEFDTAALGRLPYSILLIILFIGTFVAGIGGMGLAAIGMLLSLACVAAIVFDRLGTDIFERFGPVARSQNVVAMHEASGPLVAKGNRPVVVVAHYDSPRESFLYSSGLAKHLPLLRRSTPWCVFAASMSSLIQIMAFLPEPARRVLWVLGFLAAIPLLIVGVGALAERFSSCSLGANDNKASVAAMLGVLEAVFPSDSEEGLVARLAQQREAAELAARPVRHGEDALRSLGVLPEDCEIEYVEEFESEPEYADELGTSAIPEPPEATADLGAGEGAGYDGDTTTVTPRSSSKLAESDLPDPSSAQAYRPQVADVARRAALFDLPDPSEESSDPLAAPAPAPQAPRSSLVQHLSFADRQNARRIQDRLADFGEGEGEADGLDVPVPASDGGREQIEVIPAPEERPRTRFSLFGRKKREEQSLADYLGVEDDYDAKTGGREIGSWEELEEQDEEFSRRRKKDPRWKGGAAANEELRGTEDEPAADELLEASASLAMDELLCHDIWFVALGANSLDHAGMKAFIAKHRPQLRGAFLINLDCVGAGDLAVLSSEGLVNTRRADRRISRLLRNAADDLHVELLETPFDWSSTDATPAMRMSMRAATIMGVNDFGLPALSRTADDVAENVDPAQAALVATLVTELIRRS